jgi:cupin fold WbuC family metalloprotein
LEAYELNKLGLQKINESVYQHNGQVFVFNESIKSLLTIAAKEASNKRARICLHNSSQSEVQEMIIAMCANTKLPIHKHDDKRESLCVIDGQCEITLYDDNAQLIQTVPLAKGEIISIPKGVFHEVAILSNILILHEVAKGPFTLNSTVSLTANN